VRILFLLLERDRTCRDVLCTDPVIWEFFETVLFAGGNMYGIRCWPFRRTLWRIGVHLCYLYSLDGAHLFFNFSAQWLSGSYSPCVSLLTFTLCSLWYCISWPETHIKRQMTRQDCLPQLAGRWEQMNLKKCTVRRKIFCTLTRAAKAGQKPLLPIRRAQRTNQGRTPFTYTPWVPHLPQFQ